MHLQKKKVLRRYRENIWNKKINIYLIFIISKTNNNKKEFGDGSD